MVDRRSGWSKIALRRLDFDYFILPFKPPLTESHFRLGALLSNQCQKRPSK